MKNSLMNTYAPLSPVICKGEGVYLFDTDNNKYLDFTSGIGVNSLGYSHPKWTESVTKQACTMQHCSNIFVNPTTIEASNKLCEKAGMSKVFFANSGAEANEGAVKLAKKYSFEKYGEGRNKILSLKQSFHGRTITTLKLNGQDKFHKYFFPFPEGIDYVEANNIEDFKSKATDNVCAIIMEAVQGEGGVHPMNKDFVQQVAAICEEKDILLIFDEVQCGIGRTGKLFGFQNFDVKPNIVSLAKGIGAGLPMGAVLADEKTADAFKPGDHGSTFGGNPVACAGAIVVLDELCNEESYKKICDNGNLIKQKISEANLDEVVDVRGLGLMIGIEVKGNSSDFQKKAMDNGLLVLTAGPHVVRLLPPLVMDKEDVEKGIDILIKILQ